jgi:RHS repeat-associated protein
MLRAGVGDCFEWTGSTAITANSNGTKRAELRYHAYGEIRYASSTTSTAYRFTGQREDATMALYFYNAGFYDPALGRFIQADTLVPDPADPQSLNRYSYVRNNPLNRIDPDGQADVGAGDVGSCDDSFCSASYQALYAGWQTMAHSNISFETYIAGCARYYLYQQDPGLLWQDYGIVLGPGEGDYDATFQRITDATFYAEYYEHRYLEQLLPDSMFPAALEDAQASGDDVRVVTTIALFPAAAGITERLEDHHVFPIGRPSRSLEGRFKSLGIDPDAYTVTAPGSVNPRGGNDVRAWREWLDANPNAAPQEIFKQGGWFLYEFEVDGHYVVGPGGLVHPYGRR